MKRIFITDTTLRDGAAGGSPAAPTAEWAGIAEVLDEAGVDCIEAGCPGAGYRQYEAVRQVAGAVRNAQVMAFASCDREAIDAAVRAVRPARAPWVHVALLASQWQAPHAFARAAAVRAVEQAVAQARGAGAQVQFSVQHARAMPGLFFRQCVATAIMTGAKRVVLPDTAGHAEPAVFGRWVRAMAAFVQGDAALAVHCHDASGRAAECAMAGCANGAAWVEATIDGAGPGGGNTPIQAVPGRLSQGGMRCALEPIALERAAAVCRKCWQGGSPKQLAIHQAI